MAVAAERCCLRVFVREVGKSNEGGSLANGRIVLASPHFRLLKTAKKKQINFSPGLPSPSARVYCGIDLLVLYGCGWR